MTVRCPFNMFSEVALRNDLNQIYSIYFFFQKCLESVAISSKHWLSDWWFGTCFFIFPFHIWDVILPIDELIFFRGVGIPPSSYNPANSLATQTTNNICFCGRSKSWPTCSDADTSLGGDWLAAPGPQLRLLPTSDAFRSSKIWGPPTWFGAPRASTVSLSTYHCHQLLPPRDERSLEQWVNLNRNPVGAFTWMENHPFNEMSISISMISIE